MRRRIMTTIVALLVFVASILGSFGAGLAATEKSVVTSIKDGIEGDDPVARGKAVGAIRDLLKSAPRHAPQSLADEWMPALRAAGMHAEAAELALAGTLARPRVSPLAASLQKSRAEALLALKKHDEALVAAKSYYNVAMMRETEQAILLLADALRAARGEPAAKPFLAEQTQGATASTVAASGSVLSLIKVDPAPYEAAIMQRQGAVDYDALVELGNLLLLADRTKEARETFERAQPLAPHKGLSQSIENVARAMRAEDGSVARANAYILRLRQDGK